MRDRSIGKMESSNVTEEELMAAVLDPTQERVDRVIGACVSDPHLSSEARELCELRFQLRTLSHGSGSKPLPLEETLGRYIIDSNSVEASDRELCRLYLAVSEETRSDVAAFENFRAELPYRRARAAAGGEESSAKESSHVFSWVVGWLRPIPVLSSVAVAAIALLVIRSPMPRAGEEVDARSAEVHRRSRELNQQRRVPFEAMKESTLGGSGTETRGQQCVKVGPAGAWLRRGVCFQPNPPAPIEPSAFPLKVLVMSADGTNFGRGCDTIEDCDLPGPPPGSYLLVVMAQDSHVIGRYRFSVQE